MKVINSIFSKLDWVMETPTSYGVFHLISFLLMTIVIVIVARGLKINKEKTITITLLASTILMLTLEVVKQGLFTYEASKYQWYAFPFQFCSTPMYISLLALIIKNQKIRSFLYSFLAFFGLFGGLVVMLYPNDVFVNLVLINIQTMIHHGAMVVMGVTLILAQKVSFDLKSLLKGASVFISLAIIAQILNIIGHYADLGTFNMFFISPFQKNHLPILSNIQASQPYVVFLLSYLFGFTLAAFVVQKVCHLIQKATKSARRASWKYIEEKSLS